VVVPATLVNLHETVERLERLDPGGSVDDEPTVPARARLSR
jgi:hypothetical protein